MCETVSTVTHSGCATQRASILWSMTSLKVKPSAVHLQRREESSRDLAAVFHYPRSPCEVEECTEMDGSVRLLFWSPRWCHLPWPCSPFRILHANTHTICSLSIYPPPLDLNKRGIYQTFIMISVNDKAALNGHVDLKSRCGTLHKGLTYFPHQWKRSWDLLTSLQFETVCLWK